MKELYVRRFRSAGQPHHDHSSGKTREGGVSDVAIAKACKQLRIPKPPRGYWAKKAAGQQVDTRPALPDS